MTSCPCSILFERHVNQDLGYSEFVQKHKDASRTRSFCLVGALPTATRRFYSQRQQRQNGSDMGGGYRVSSTVAQHLNIVAEIFLLRYCVKTLWGHEQWVRSVSPSEDGKLLVTASSDLVCAASLCKSLSLTVNLTCNNRQTSIIFDITSGEEKLQLRGHENVVEAAEFAPVASYAVIRQMTGIRVSR
jgi:WD40 repeat protein